MQHIARIACLSLLVAVQGLKILPSSGILGLKGTNVRKMALLATPSTTTPLKDLCEISYAACDAVAPMLQAFYAKITSGETSDATKLKSDATFFSIADGIVQHMFIEHLFSGNKFGAIVGEEDETTVNISTPPYTVDELVVPSEFEPLIKETLSKVKALASRIDTAAYKDITVFVDPIDGTREFATGQGQYVTILIGYNDKKGQPVAGIMYRPLTTPITWAAGAKSEGVKIGVLDLATVPKPRGMLVTDGKVSPFLAEVINQLGYERIPSVASGNRAMMILEGKAGAYLRDTGGFAKWDTSGPQAVIEAYGGTMSQLPDFLKSKGLTSYTHLPAKENLDFTSGEITLTLHNARVKSDVPKEGKVLVEKAVQVKEYSCLRGLVTLDAANMNEIDRIHAVMTNVQKAHPPTYT